MVPPSIQDRRAHRGQVLGRVGLAERAADRPAVAHHRVGDHALGVGEDRVREQRRLEQVPVTGHRADPQLCAVEGDVAQLVRERIDVDQVLRLSEPQLHHRQQAVPAREQPGLRSELF